MPQKNSPFNDNYIFGLDIGTRSIVGVVGYRGEDNRFHMVAHAMKEHDTRAMIDGQIHDIARVTETIRQVKKTLEDQLDVTLHKVCIAAAGRVLKTAMIHVEQETDPMQIIDENRINALELLGMERAHQEVNTNLEANEMGYHCVGYTVSRYYLNDFEITSLKDHKGKRIAADVLATFLPQEVVESLYVVVQNAGMEVYSLTLEPIAAINLAIPYQYRLLNIALVDIGAGTSDIAITKNGSIIAYGMIPIAGDEMTEAIVHKYLVDFNTAEQVKRKAFGKGKSIAFKDVIGIKHSIPKTEVNAVLKEAAGKITARISEKITELNNGRSTNAIFIVGGGGQVKGFTKILSHAIGLDSDRVALRGKEVLSDVDFGDLKLTKGPDLVTPIGICLTGFENNKHDFIEVYLNDEPVRIFDNNRLTVMDVAAYKGVDPKRLLAKRGRDLRFKVNGNERRLPGDAGVPAVIMLNNKQASLSSHVTMNDYISIINAKKGRHAALSTYQLVDDLELKVYFNEQVFKLKPEVYLNGELLQMNYDIHDDDDIRLRLPSLKSFLTQNNLDDYSYVYYINGNEADDNASLADMDHITRRSKERSKVEVKHTISKTITVSVNQAPVTLEGKSSYVFVDIFDVYPFDLSKPQGNVISKINGEKANYMGEIKEGDVLEVYWEV